MTTRILSFAKKSAASVSYLAVGTLVAAAASLISQMIAARIMGPASFGIFAAALTAINFVGPIASFGISGFWLRVFGREGGGAIRWVRASLNLCCSTILLASVLVTFWLLLQADKPLRAVGLALLPLIAAQAFVSLAIASRQVHGDYLTASFWYAAPQVTRLLAVAILFLAPMSFLPLNLALLNGFLAALLALLAVRSVLSSHLRPASSFSSPFVVARESWQFGLDGILYLSYHQLGLVVVLFTLGESAAGIFGAAFLFLNASYMLPSILFQKFLLPKLHRWANKSPQSLVTVATWGTGLMLAAGIFVALCIFLLAPLLMDTAFGSEYLHGATVLQVLVTAIPLKYAASSVGAVLTSGYLLRTKIAVMGTGALVYLPACYLLASAHGLTGAAAATVIVELLLLLGFSFSVRSGLKEALSA